MSDTARPDAFYDMRGRKYWVRLRSGIFLEQDSGDLKLRLRMAGLSDARCADRLNPVEQTLLHYQDERHVHYAGSLAGYRVGLHEIGGQKVLVTQEARDVWAEPHKRKIREKDFPNICRLIAEALDWGDHKQGDYFAAWLKLSLESLRAGQWRPGQMLVLAGPPSSGKNFLQWFITAVLGGRAASPTRYMLGRTQFNQDLAAAEHLQISDEKAEKNFGARQQFGAMVKQFTVNEDMSVHGKGANAITLPVWHRLTLSCNEEPENLAIIPPLEDGLMDKVMLMQAGTISPALLGLDRVANRARFEPELPLFRSWLLQWTILAELQTRPNEVRRFGVDTFHHPALLEALTGMQPETHLASLIDEIVFKKTADLAHWTGGAQELVSELACDARYRSQVETLVPSGQACGTYLARLAKRFPERFQHRKTNGKLVWTITRP